MTHFPDSVLYPVQHSTPSCCRLRAQALQVHSHRGGIPHRLEIRKPPVFPCFLLSHEQGRPPNGQKAPFLSRSAISKSLLLALQGTCGLPLMFLHCCMVHQFHYNLWYSQRLPGSMPTCTPCQRIKANLGLSPDGSRSSSCP